MDTDPAVTTVTGMSDMEDARRKLNRAARRANKVATINLAFYWAGGIFLLLLCGFGVWFAVALS